MRESPHGNDGTERVMNIVMEKRVVELTQEVLARFWQLDCEYVLSLCADDVMWIAPEQELYMRGIDAVRADLFANREELVPCHQSAAEYTVVQNCGRAATVVGRYLVTTDDGAPFFMQVQQRCSFTWELIEDEPRIRSIYVSNPRGELAVADGETFVNALGKMASRYMEARIAEKGDHRRIVFSDTEGTSHFIPLSDIVSVSAKGKRCVFHTVSGAIEARMSFSSAAAKLGEDFITVHRSHLANASYVSTLRPFTVEMADGERIRVPERRFTEVRKAIMRIHEND